MGPCVILSPASRLEPRVKSIETIGLCDISSYIKFSPPSRLEPGVDSININTIGYR